MALTGAGAGLLLLQPEGRRSGPAGNAAGPGLGPALDEREQARGFVIPALTIPQEPAGQT